MLCVHRNPNWKELLKSCESFLRKSQFSTLTDLNPGFGGPLDMLGIFFVNVIYTTLQKKSFRHNFFWIAWVQKCHFGNFSILAKWYFWTHAWNSKTKLPKDFFWSIINIPFQKNIPNMSQGPSNPWFRSIRVENWDSLKKDSQDFKYSF